MAGPMASGRDPSRRSRPVCKGIRSGADPQSVRRRMTMLVRWTEPAARALEHLQGYLDTDSPRAARTVTKCIRLAVYQLAEYPRIGRPGRVVGTSGPVSYPGSPISCRIASEIARFKCKVSITHLGSGQRASSERLGSRRRCPSRSFLGKRMNRRASKPRCLPLRMGTLRPSPRHGRDRRLYLEDLPMELGSLPESAPKPEDHPRSSPPYGSSERSGSSRRAIRISASASASRPSCRRTRPR